MVAEPYSLGPFPGSQRTQLPEEVANYVRELIITGEVGPGEFLRMDRISRAVGVSNTPVREGLLALRSEGFVRQVPRRGFVATPFSRQDIEDLFWAQARLAGELTARAAQVISERQLERLDTIVRAFPVAVANGDQEGIVGLGHDFHREINLAARSSRLAQLAGSVVRHVPNRFFATIDGQVNATHDEHPLLLDALRARNPTRARVIMEKHITNGADRLIETLEQRGMWAPQVSRVAREATVRST